MQMAKTRMQRQVTLRIDNALANRLEHLARRMRRGRSEVIRLALAAFSAPEQPARRPIELVHDLIGRLETGVPDLGQRGRQHLVKRLRGGRVIRLGGLWKGTPEVSEQLLRRVRAKVWARLTRR